MGNLVIKMTKTREIQQADNGILTWADVTSDDLDYNPDNGYININTFDIGFESGIEVNSDANLTLKRPRTSIGNEKVIPLSLKCEYKKGEITDITAEELMNAVYYLLLASKSGYYGLMYWMPNSDSEIIGDDSQCQDFYTSAIRPLHKMEWSDAKLSSTDSEYTGTAYEPFVIPVLITSVTVKQKTDKVYGVNVELLLANREN